jgi:hypothetical protein
VAYDLVGGEYDAGVQGEIEDLVNAVGSEYEVGADGAVRRKQRRPGQPQAAGQPGSGLMARTKGEVRKRAAIGFGAFSIVTLGQATLTARVQRAFHPDRLLIVPSAVGLLFLSIRVGDEEQLLNPGVSAEAYGPSALADSRTDDFTPCAPGMDLSLLLSNPTAGTITGSATMKGLVFR